MIGMMSGGSVMAADYSASITAGGIDLYAITGKGVDLVRGSPYVLPEPGTAYPRTPAMLTLSPAHDFLYVVYEQQPYHGDLSDDVSVVGFKITSHGLVKKWSFDTNMDPAEYKYISLSVGLNSVIVYSKPAGLFATVYSEEGDLIAGDGSEVGGDQLLSGHVDPDNHFYYSCRVNTSAIKYLEVYSLPKNGPTLQQLLVTSYDPSFMKSICK
jgi:hypothetical protein